MTRRTLFVIALACLIAGFCPALQQFGRARAGDRSPAPAAATGRLGPPANARIDDGTLATWFLAHTGPTTKLKASGSVSSSAAGQTIQDLDVTGTVTVGHANVTVKNCRINANGAPHAVRQTAARGGLVVQNCELYGFKTCCVGPVFTDYTVTRSYVHDSQTDGFKAEGNVTVQWCYVTRIGLQSGSHADGLQSSKGSGLRVEHTFFNWPYDNGVGESTSCSLIKADFAPIDDVLYEGNWLNGGQYAIYSIAGTKSPSPTNARYINNRFGRVAPGGAHYGLFDVAAAADGGPTITGNVYDDDGSPATVAGRAKGKG